MLETFLETSGWKIFQEEKEKFSEGEKGSWGGAIFRVSKLKNSIFEMEYGCLRMDYRPDL